MTAAGPERQPAHPDGGRHAGDGQRPVQHHPTRPTGHLDPPTAQALGADLRRALAGRLVVCVTHDRDLARDGDTVLELGGRTLAAPVAG